MNKRNYAPNIIKACDYRINELKNTLKGASDASTRIAMYKQVKRGQIPLSSISERNKRYLAQTGSSNSYVTRVQEALKGLGYTSQTISGILDSTTLNNIAYFQSQNGIYMTGWLDQETYDKITSRYTSYTNAQQIAARAPYVYLSNVHMEGKELVVTMQGNANTTMLIIELRYNGTVVDAKTLYNTNTATIYLSPRESGIHYIEFFARNANDEIYEAPVKEIDINIPKGDGSTPLGITGAFCLGLGDSLASSVQGVGNVILHPIKTIQSIGEFAGNLAATVVNAGSVGELRNQAVDALTEIITITWNQLDNNTTEENARVVGKVVGDIVIAVLVTKGAEKGISALKDSANSGKLAQSVKGVMNGTDSVDDVAGMLLTGGTLFQNGGQVTYASIVANASEFAGKSADDIANMLRNAGYKGVYVDNSIKEFSRAKKVVVGLPDKNHNISQIIVSPGSSYHGNVPYVKISTNDIGIIKVVDASPSQYVSAGEANRSVIFLKP